MSYMFYHCKNIISIDVSKFDTSFVKNMRYMFAGCTQIKRIDISKFKLTNVTDIRHTIQGMFSKCYNLRTIVQIRLKNPSYKLSYIDIMKSMIADE